MSSSYRNVHKETLIESASILHRHVRSCILAIVELQSMQSFIQPADVLLKQVKEDTMAFEIFISYANEDQAYLKELEKHLANLKRQNIIASWYDGDITPGTEWESQIMERLNNAQIILLLVSADFINSEFCYGIELKQALARQDANQARVIPIILRPVDWKGAPFAKLQALPTRAKPVTRWPSHDDAFLDIVQGIRKAIDDLPDKGKTSNP